MPRDYTFGPKFKLIVDHLKAVRTLYGYVNGVELKKDMQDFFNYLQQDLSRSILRPAGWEDLYPSNGSLFSSPNSGSAENQIPKWGVVEDDVIAIEIYPAWPVQDEDGPFTRLYVPEDWDKRHQFIAALKAPPGFEHVGDYSDGECDAVDSVFKYIQYESHLGADGRFNATGFIEAFREATKSLVAMEEEIDQILKGLG